MNLVSTGTTKGHAKGFTLIELLVVIAIIGILSAVVLASLSTARSKGQDARVQEQLSGARSAAEIYYSTNGSYGANTNACDNMFADTSSGLNNLSAASNYPNSVAPVCRAAGGTASASASWAMSHVLSNGTSYFCVDSTGAATTTAANNISANADTTCSS